MGYDLKAEALRWFERGYQLQIEGDLVGAVALYRKSLDIQPTAEAHTFLGWAYSRLGLLEEAIQQCLRAIDLDPTFGNPYNDLGAYLLEMGRVDEAIPWLEQAVDAPRYENRAFPHMNLGRAYEALGLWDEAMISYRQALEEDPSFVAAARAIRHLRAKLN